MTCNHDWVSMPTGITVRLVCRLPIEVVDEEDMPVDAERTVTLPCLPPVGSLIQTPSGRDAVEHFLAAASEIAHHGDPGVLVIGHLFDAGQVTVVCLAVDGDWLSARDMVAIDGWSVVDDVNIDWDSIAANDLDGGAV